MAKSSKRFLPLFVVVTSGIIFFGEISQKILPPAQAQPPQGNFLVARRGEPVFITIEAGQFVGDMVRRIKSYQKVVWRCFRTGYGVAPSGSEYDQGAGHIIDLYNITNRSRDDIERGLLGNPFKSVRVPYDGQSVEVNLSPGYYAYRMDKQIGYIKVK